MFDFRIINTPDGNQIIDTTLKTPDESLTPVQMVEYVEVEYQLDLMSRAKRKSRVEASHKKNPVKKFIHR